MFSRARSSDWLSDLAGTSNDALLAEQGKQDRHMWCTAGFFDLAGYSILADGGTSPLDRARDTGVCVFEPIQVTCSDASVPQWRSDPGSRSRFILHVRDVKHYQSAMTKAMNSLLAAK